jgi:hypothetical protein
VWSSRGTSENGKSASCSWCTATGWPREDKSRRAGTWERSFFRQRPCAQASLILRYGIWKGLAPRHLSYPQRVAVRPCASTDYRCSLCLLSRKLPRRGAGFIMPMQLRELYMCANGQERGWSPSGAFDNGAVHKQPLAFILGCIVLVLLLLLLLSPARSRSPPGARCPPPPPPPRCWLHLPFDATVGQELSTGFVGCLWTRC